MTRLETREKMRCPVCGEWPARSGKRWPGCHTWWTRDPRDCYERKAARDERQRSDAEYAEKCLRTAENKERAASKRAERLSTAPGGAC